MQETLNEHSDNIGRNMESVKNTKEENIESATTAVDATKRLAETQLVTACAAGRRHVRGIGRGAVSPGRWRLPCAGSDVMFNEVQGRVNGVRREDGSREGADEQVCTGTCDRQETHDGEKCPKGKCAKEPGSCAKVQCSCKGSNGAEIANGECPCKCKCENRCPRVICAEAKKARNPPGCAKKKADDTCGCECKCTCNVIGYYYDAKGELVNVIDAEGSAHFYLGQKCRFPCTNCGKLCSQDAFRRGCYIGVPILLVSVAIVFVCRLYPGPFRKMFYGLRAAFANSIKGSGASTNNLAGGRIHEEMDTDEYSAFPFKGLM
ncbi:hypothetical protein, conserved [Babesia ovata]|uniref:Uncharacterized protein n=1 Tax=Babesia ovata TaxID=189622 RepID=A0A2H6KGB9_9APIC|nr:uncharacterized protein BOVATA_035020 [Babesia ovata]GBE62009.1 hypothetical protein, conserved [Babesia ovata]